MPGGTNHRIKEEANHASNARTKRLARRGTCVPEENQQRGRCWHQRKRHRGVHHPRGCGRAERDPASGNACFGAVGSHLNHGRRHADGGYRCQPGRGVPRVAHRFHQAVSLRQRRQPDCHAHRGHRDHACRCYHDRHAPGRDHRVPENGRFDLHRLG